MAEKQNSKENKKKNSKIEELEKELEETKNDYLRARADYDNYRKRVEKELQEARDRAIVDFVQDLLPAIDNFETSLKMTDNTDMFIKGVEMIHRNLLDTLKEHKIETFEPKIGEDFDPNLHDPHVVEKEAEPGKVLAIVKKGFKHKDVIVRPSRVEVVKNEWRRV